MITVNQKDRLTISEVLKHPWFQTLSEPLTQQETRDISMTISKLVNYSAPKRLNTELQKVLVQHMTADGFSDLKKTFESID